MLDAVYRAYIDLLNWRQFDQLPRFVHDNILYNDAVMTSTQYGDMIAKNADAIPDLRFNIGLLVIQQDLVAARIDFDCTPTGEFLGQRPNGRRVRFSENIFYQFRDDRIAQVWSVIDVLAIQRQLAHAA